MAPSILIMPQWMKEVYRAYFDGRPVKRIYVVKYFNAPWAEYYWPGRDLPDECLPLKEFLKKLEENK